MNTQHESATQEADYQDNPIWLLTGAKITAVGANAAGEIYFSTDRGHEFVVGKDEAGEISLFQLLQGEGQGT